MMFIHISKCLNMKLFEKLYEWTAQYLSTASCWSMGWVFNVTGGPTTYRACGIWMFPLLSCSTSIDHSRYAINNLILVKIFPVSTDFFPVITARTAACSRTRCCFICVLFKTAKKISMKIIPQQLIKIEWQFMLPNTTFILRLLRNIFSNNGWFRWIPRVLDHCRWH